MKGLVTKVTCKSWFENKDDGEYTVEFFYDQQKRVIRMVQTDEYDTPSGESGTVLPKAEATITITYGNGVASYYMAYSEDGVVNPNRWEKGSVKLSADGRVVSGEYTNNNNIDYEEWHRTYTLTYDADYYLVKSEEMDEDAPSSSSLKWDGENLIEVNYGSDHDLIDRAVYGSVRNNSNIDLNWLFILDSEGFCCATGDHNRIFAMLGMTGKRTYNLPTKVTDVYGYVYVYTYETTEKGIVTKITSEYGNGSARDEYVITYGK